LPGQALIANAEAALSWETQNDLLFIFISIILQLEDRFIYVSWCKTDGLGPQ